MIIIFSEPSDYNANCVIEWLQYFKCRYKRINLSEEDYRNIKIEFRNGKSLITLKLKSGDFIEIDKISYFFYRSGLFEEDLDKIEQNVLPKKYSHAHHSLEFKTLTNFFYAEVSKKSIGYLSQIPLNKLQQLKFAQEVGLSIPETLISGYKVDVDCFSEKSSIINKAIQECVLFQVENEIYVQRATDTNLNKLDQEFFPTLFQKRIEKFFEVRTFYLDGSCYSIAIYDQDKPLMTDYRDGYDTQSYCPFTLPTEIEYKVQKLMDKLNLISGSLDIICDESNDYYFLEVNTQGQYDWVSEYGNYMLHKKIAEFLVKRNNLNNENTK